MKVYIDPKFIVQSDIKQMIDAFPMVEFVDTIDHFDIEVAMIPWANFITEENLSKLPNLKWIQLLSAGYDGTDFNLLKKHQIIYTNAKDIYHISIAEDVLTKILVLNRNYKIYLDNMKQGIWKPIRREPELYGSTVGILGTGSIGKEIAKRLKAFDTHIIGYRKSDRPETYFDEIVTDDEGLSYLLKTSDYVIVTLPLNDKTEYFLSKEKLSLMKSNALFINIARGKVVDQDALSELLKDKKIRGAGLDVTTPEPLPKDHELWSMPNVVITPHNSSSSNHLLSRLTELMTENLSNYLNHRELKFIVNE
jgi:phosphoglycerate dehydrogenase-like enzyme